MVISPLAIPWFINSSIIKDVSPLTFNFFAPMPSFFEVLDGDERVDCLLVIRPLTLDVLEGEPMTPFLGPFSRF
jgi:hypothetical protein